jgi:uncharacterized membrane protein YphA (DoxX/SURF4 family)
MIESVLIRSLEIVVGGYYAFWGLNGFLNWMKLPRVRPEMERFIAKVNSLKIVMPTIKFIEIVCGALMVVGQFSNIAVFVLFPIVLVIVVSQVALNRPEGLKVAALAGVPYLVLALLLVRAA